MTTRARRARRKGVYTAPRRSERVNLRRITEDKRPFRLLDLPPEIRNIIVGLALTGSGAISLTTSDDPDRGLGPYPAEPPLLCTCRQLRTEGLAVFYSCNALFSYLIDVYMHWILQLTAEKRGWIRELRGFAPGQADTTPSSVLSTLKDIQARFMKRGITLRKGVLHVPIKVNDQVVWTNDPEKTAKEAEEQAEVLAKEAERKAKAEVRVA